MLAIKVRNRRCVETFYKRQPGPLDWCGQVIGSSGTVHGSTRVLYQGHDLGQVSVCLSVSHVPYRFGQGGYRVQEMFEM